MSQHTPNELTEIFKRDRELLTRLKREDAQLFDFFLNCAGYCLGIVHHIVVGEVKDRVAPRSQIGIAPPVAPGLHIVAEAVEFYDQPLFPAQEIRKSMGRRASGG